MGCGAHSPWDFYLARRLRIQEWDFYLGFFSLFRKEGMGFLFGILVEMSRLLLVIFFLGVDSNWDGASIFGGGVA